MGPRPIICGICGHFELVPPAGGLAAALGRLAPRGPDSAGAVEPPGRPDLGLGATRLAVIDLAGGTQPIANEDTTLHAAMNGEIFNHRALRRELEAAGHRFRTRCDTEVVVHGFEEWGPGLPARLEGEFALAVLDLRARPPRLFLARDRPGVKPLFLARRGPGLAFASEPKALFPLLDPPPRPDPAALPFYVQLGYRPGTATAWHGLERLPPAHWLLAEAGRIRVERYWRRPDPEPARAAVGTAALVDEARLLVRASVAARLESEVPLGAFLSGGIDSSAVVAAMADEARGPVLSFSAGFAEAAFDEREPARQVAAALGTRHTELVLAPGPVAALLDRVVQVYDEPFGDSSALPTLGLVDRAREAVTVALSGDGGDEVFAGYVHMKWHGKAESLARLPPSLLRGSAGLLRRVSRRGSRLLRLADRLDLAAGGAADRHLHYSRLVPGPELAELFPGIPADLVEAEMRPRFPAHLAPLDRVLAYDFETTLPGDFLMKVDRASASRGLEVRVPLLSTALLEWAFRLPAEAKLPGGMLKALLKGTLRGRLPDRILDRPKHGFTAPLGPWLRGELAPLARARLLEPGSALAPHTDRPTLRRLLDAHAGGHRDLGELVWRLLVAERWLRSPLGGGA